MKKLIAFFAISRAQLTKRRLAKGSHLTEVADTESSNTANPRITRLIRSEKSSRNTKTRKVNN